jgi:hypothetical protein
VSADSVTPSSGTGLDGTFALRYSAAGGTSGLTAWVWFAAVLESSAADSCLLHYDSGSSTLSLLDDAGAVWHTARLGSASVLRNSQCAVAAHASSAVTSGNTLTLNLAITFTPAYAGSKNVYLFAQDSSGANSGWQDRGDWSIASMVSQAGAPGGPAGSLRGRRTWPVRSADV